jgi:hypothetical protein
MTFVQISTYSLVTSHPLRDMAAVPKAPPPAVGFTVEGPPMLTIEALPDFPFSAPHPDDLWQTPRGLHKDLTDYVKTAPNPPLTRNPMKSSPNTDDRFQSLVPEET